MKKISLLTKTTFHAYNIILILIYLYPGSILGWLIYGNIEKQPQLTSDFSVFSSNHVYAFLVLSLLGFFAFSKSKQKFLFIYLFCMSFCLELSHILIPDRSFEYSDLIGNIFGVLVIFILSKLFKIFRKKNV